MVSPQILVMADALRKQARETVSLEAARAAVRTNLEVLFGEALTSAQEANLDSAFAIVEAEAGPVEILRTSSMYDRRPAWYSGPRVGDRHWPALEGYLRNAKGWDEATVSRSIGNASTEIVSLLEDPAKDAFRCRGLVIGYVQSGKTANMTAVIAKAVDAGYNFVIVLAGLTNKLRQQTQRRLEADVVDRYRNYWQLLTSAEDAGDFRGLANGGFFVPDPPSVQIAVVKKNVAPLKRLIAAVGKTPPAAVRRLKVLVIDDEADQASVNSASNEMNMTRINELVRELLHCLPCVSYVGYTATPFANVFINPYGMNRELDDLYPKDFITALERPRGYFGTEELFGLDPADPADPQPDEEGLDVIRTIPDDEVAQVQPARSTDRETFQPAMPRSLEDAVLHFLASCGVRRARGQTGEHMSMLVHTSSFVAMHRKIAELIENWLGENGDELLRDGSAVRRRMREVWDAEAGRLPVDITQARSVGFEEMTTHLCAVLEVLKVPVENGLSTDRINYAEEPKTYIVVGGSVLARGLTLEGLMVSYFLRGSSQYDTLLQMGRWFGYRGGYEDLPRIWMTLDLEDQFRALATIEQEIREDVAQYSRREVSPMEFAVRVRSIPGMAITAAAKMRAAVECDISYSGKHVQTIQFDHRDLAISRANWASASALLGAAQQLGKVARGRDGRPLWVDVPKSAIVRFLRDFRVETSRNDLRPEFLLGYINGENPDLELWNVAVVTGNADPSGEPLGLLGAVGTVIRSRLAGDDGGTANIKALMSRQDVMTDCPDVAFDGSLDWSGLKQLRAATAGNCPLLLLYPINRLSPPRRGGARTDLDAVMDQVGIGLVFPGNVAGAGGYYHVDLNPPSSDELDAMDEEISELEAAHLVG